MKRRLLVALVLVVVVALAWFFWPRPEPGYPLRQEVVVQPLDHARLDGPAFEQFVDILEPAGAGSDAPVFFVLGGFRHSDTVLVTEDGYQFLTHYPVDLEDLVILDRRPLARLKGAVVRRAVGI
jgi:hypothetical protein